MIKYSNYFLRLTFDHMLRKNIFLATRSSEFQVQFRNINYISKPHHSVFVRNFRLRVAHTTIFIRKRKIFHLRFSYLLYYVQYTLYNITLRKPFRIRLSVFNNHLYEYILYIIILRIRTIVPLFATVPNQKRLVV